MKILIVDDHAVMRAGLRLLLQEKWSGICPDEVESGGQALQMIRENSYDVLLLDLTRADISGFEVVGKIKREKPLLPVVVVGLHTDRNYTAKAYSLGADGYISKECSPVQLIQAIEVAAEGNKYVSEALLNEVLSGLQTIISTGGVDAESKVLSIRERQVSKMLASGATNKEIAWQLSLSVKTVSTYKMRILKKLKLTGLAGLIRHELANCG